MRHRIFDRYSETHPFWFI